MNPDTDCLANRIESASPQPTLRDLDRASLRDVIWSGTRAQSRAAAAELARRDA